MVIGSVGCGVGLESALNNGAAGSTPAVGRAAEARRLVLAVGVGGVCASGRRCSLADGFGGIRRAAAEGLGEGVGAGLAEGRRGAAASGAGAW